MNNELREMLGDMYDFDAIEIDIRNSNYDESQIHTYHKCYIVAQSLDNGQMKQAVEQIKRYNLSRTQLLDYCTKSDLIKIFGVNNE